MTDGRLAVPVPPQQRRSGTDARALLAAADRDADALADRLHDGALQALVVARYAADAAVRGADPVLARDAVQEALVALRRAVWDLRPRGDEDLTGALTELSSRRAAAGSAPLALAVDPTVVAALAPACRAAAFRFVQAVASTDGASTDGASTDGAAAVTVGAEAGHAVVTAGGSPDDVPGWSARAAALGGRLDTSGPCARLLLPLLDEPEGDR